MIKRTTVEIDPELLERAREALGETTARGTVEAALRLVIERAHRTESQRRYLQQLATHADLSVLGSEETWR